MEKKSSSPKLVKPKSSKVGKRRRVAKRTSGALSGADPLADFRLLMGMIGGGDVFGPDRRPPTF